MDEYLIVSVYTPVGNTQKWLVSSRVIFTFTIVFLMRENENVRERKNEKKERKKEEWYEKKRWEKDK